MRPVFHTRADIPNYLAAIWPRKNVSLAARVADVLLSMLWDPYRVQEGLGDALNGVSLDHFSVAPTVPVVVGNEVQACRDKFNPLIAMYVGGMGTRDKNFCNAPVRRYGFEQAAEEMKDAHLTGRRPDAVRLVPDKLVDEVALVGPKARIADRLKACEQSGISILIIASPTSTKLQVMAELVL
jgi:alkanesulfonate monooxygenase SsuD/methylene tetrahydromethanopterin reductase-like flavin-dependent oxidoreductase (luciferase family)